MKHLIVALAVGASVLFGITPAHADAAPTAVEACLAAHPGAVTSAGVDETDNVVCVTDRLKPSPGNDTYLWVGVDSDPSMVLDSPVFVDPGLDTLSLANWSHAFDESWGLFGVHYRGPTPETVVYTPFNDVVGDASACGSLSGSNGVTFQTGLGADLVQCIVGDIQTQGGDDTIVGVTLGTVASAGSGDDIVIGDAGADVISLGSGDDVAVVAGKGVDDVKGGTGADRVVASRNDDVASAKVVTK